MEKSEFEQKISQTEKPLVVDFWAPWCAPCRATKPILENLSREFAGRVDLLQVNADDSHPLLEQYHVRGIPTVLAFRNGNEVGRIVGAQGETGFRQVFQSLAEGKEVTISLAPFDRVLRLGAGAMLIIFGIYARNWLVLGLGCLLIFLGVYDRCPVWKAIKGFFKRKPVS
jgi:thioredoxin 1